MSDFPKLSSDTILIAQTKHKLRICQLLRQFCRVAVEWRAFYTNIPCLKTFDRYLPWLYNLPANTAAQGQREFLECVAHVRLMSWLLLGSVNHTLKFGNTEVVTCQPIPLEASCHIADHIQVILAGIDIQIQIWNWSKELFGRLDFVKIYTLSWNFRICRAEQDVGGSHVLPLPCIYPLSAMDSLPGTNYR